MRAVGDCRLPAEKPEHTMEMDLPGRIAGFIDKAGPLGLVVGGLFILVLFLLAVLGKRTALLGIYLLLLMFSGFAVEAVDAGSTLMRWLVMFLIAMTCYAGARSPGAPAVMLGVYAILGIMMSPLAPSTSWAIQQSTLLLVISIPMAAAAAHQLRTMDDIVKLLKLFIVAGGLYVILGLVTLPSLAGGARFAGAGTSAPLFVLTGGLLLPVALWGAMQKGIRQWRVYCAVIAVCTGMLCLISGQRTGTLAGFIGCLPLLARFGMKKLMIGLLLLAVGLALVYGVLQAMPDQAAFVERRFTSIDTTGRLEAWATALAMCLRSPFIGHGVGSSAEPGFGFHNVYLISWFEVGLVGLILYAGALVWMAFRATGLVLQRFNREASDVARLILGLTLAGMAAAFFESKLASPSNIAMFVTIVSSVILVRLKELTVAAPDRIDQVGPQAQWTPHYWAEGYS